MADEIDIDEPDTDNENPTEALQAELDRTRKALKEANREAAERRKKLTRLEQLEAEAEERRAAEMTEAEKLQRKLEEAERKAADAETRSRETLIRAAFVAEAARIGAAHPDDVYRLADLSEVDVADDGRVTGVDVAVKTLADAGRIPMGSKRAPDLEGEKGERRRRDGEPALTPSEIAMAKALGMKPDVYQQRKAEIKDRNLQE